MVNLIRPIVVKGTGFSSVQKMKTNSKSGLVLLCTYCYFLSLEILSTFICLIIEYQEFFFILILNRTEMSYNGTTIERADPPVVRRRLSKLHLLTVLAFRANLYLY